MNSKGKYYLTTAIAYTSGKPHIGNVYEIVLADAIARFKRLEGYDVFFQTGTDEHGQKNELKAVAAACRDKAEQKMADLRVADAITEVFALFKRCNKYIDETMPWALAKDEEKKPRLATVLYNLVDCIALGASLLKPFMPETAEKIFAQLNTQARDWEDLDKTGLYPSGNKVTEKPEILFAGRPAHSRHRDRAPAGGAGGF